MKQILFLILTGLLFINYSCTSVDGDCDGDEIKLSKNKVIFDGNKSTIKITTKGKWWWVSDLYFNGKYINPHEEGTQKKDYFLIKKDDFTIERKSKTEIFIEMQENKTGQKRELHISVQAGNCFDGITVIQEPQKRS